MAVSAVTAPVKLAATTVVVAGETAGSVVSATGKVAASGVRAAGAVGSSGLEATARLAQAGMVTFVDVSTAGVVRVPWQPGLTLGRAGAAARLDFARRTVEVVRGGRLVFAATRNTGSGAELASGDVVRLRD